MKKPLIMAVTFTISIMTLGCSQATPPNIINPDIPSPPPVTEIIPPQSLTPPLEYTPPSNISPAYKISTTHKVLINKNLNIRSLPSTSSQVLFTAKANSFLPYITTQNGWHMVVYNNDIAYISSSSSLSKLVDINYKIPQPSPIEKVIQVGMSKLGVPYQYGAPRILNWDFSVNNKFTGRTFDCSSFVQYAFYKGANIKLYGDSRSMSRQYKTVPHSKIKRGDIIFMTSSARQDNVGIERIGHVAIYLGNNQILHTYGSGGVKVQTYSSFWRNRFIQAKRVF